MEELTDVRDDPSSHSLAKRETSGLSHFNFFLRAYYCPQNDIDVFEAADIPYEGVPEQPHQEAIFEFFDKLFGLFFSYMGVHARYGCEPDAPRLGCSTADQYCSGVKGYFCNRFRTRPAIPVFQDKQWKKLRQKLLAKFRERKRASGDHDNEERNSSTRDDREWMAIGCIWDGTVETAEFFHLLNTTFHCSARGSEVSLPKVTDLHVAEVNEDVYQYKILRLDIQRQKDGPHQSKSLYPHRDGVLECYYFSLIYLVVMVGCGNERMLPTFSKAALTKTGVLSDSKVSALWTRIFDRVRNKFDALDAKINEKLSSHCNKRGSNQLLAETPSVSGPAQIFHSGWENRGRDSLWDYTYGSFTLSQQTAKALSKWTARIGDLTLGGQPPTFSDIDDRKDLLLFTNTLFEDDIDKRWSPDVRELLVTALFLRYEQFLCVLRSPLHPESWIPDALDDYNPLDERFDLDKSDEYQSIRNHLFVCRVEQALEKSGVHILKFKSWCENARRAFLNRNMPAIPTTIFPQYSGDEKDIRKLSMDPRCFADHFSALASVVQSTHVAVQEIRHRLNDITEIMSSESELKKYTSHHVAALARSVKRIEDHLFGDSPVNQESPTSSKKILSFSVSLKGCDPSDSLVDVFVKFFAEDYRAGYELDKKSTMWKEDLDRPQKTKLKNAFAEIKRAVRFVLFNSDSYPQRPEDPVHYKEILRRTATLAMERIRATLNLETNKHITVSTIRKQPGFIELEKTLSLPSGIPSDDRKFFNSN